MSGVLKILEPATWADVFHDGSCVFNPATQCVEVRWDDGRMESRPVSANYLYLRCVALPDGSVWTVGQHGETGHLIVTYSVDGRLDLGPTFGQQVCAIAFDGEHVRVAFTSSATMWDDWAIDPVTHAEDLLSADFMTPTSQGMLDWFPPADPLWTDQHRSVTINGVTMLCADEAKRSDDIGSWLVVGQPVVGPPQVTGVVSFPAGIGDDGKPEYDDRPTSIFKGLLCNLFPHVCVDGDGWRVSTSLLNNQVAMWTGTTADLPPYDGTTPLPRPQVTFTKPMLCGLYASPLKYGTRPTPYPAQMLFLTSGDKAADVRKVYDGPLIGGGNPPETQGIYLATSNPVTWGPTLPASLALAKATGVRCWAYYDGKGEPYPQALLNELDANAYPMLSGYALQGERVGNTLQRLAYNAAQMDRKFLFVQPYYAPYLTVEETWELLKLLLQLANDTPLCIGTAGFQVDRPQPAPYAFGPWEQPVRDASTAPESWVYAPKSPGGGAARLIMGAQ